MEGCSNELTCDRNRASSERDHSRSRLDERVLAAFKLTGDVDNDFVSNEYLRGFAGECGCSVKKLKVQLLGMNASIREGRGKMDGESKYGKGLRGLLRLKLEPLEEESA